MALGDREIAEISNTVPNPGTGSSRDIGLVLVRNQSKEIFFGSEFVFLLRPTCMERTHSSSLSMNQGFLLHIN